MVILARVVDLKQSQASFLPHLAVWSYLQSAQMPTSWGLAIFVPTTTTDGQTDYFTPCMHAHGVINTWAIWAVPAVPWEKLALPLPSLQEVPVPLSCQQVPQEWDVPQCQKRTAKQAERMACYHNVRLEYGSSHLLLQFVLLHPSLFWPVQTVEWKDGQGKHQFVYEHQLLQHDL